MFIIDNCNHVLDIYIFIHHIFINQMHCNYSSKRVICKIKCKEKQLIGMFTIVKYSVQIKVGF
jgi:hypothetical protein